MVWRRDDDETTISDSWTRGDDRSYSTRGTYSTYGTYTTAKTGYSEATGSRRSRSSQYGRSRVPPNKNAAYYAPRDQNDYSVVDGDDMGMSLFCGTTNTVTDESTHAGTTWDEWTRVDEPTHTSMCCGGMQTDTETISKGDTTTWTRASNSSGSVVKSSCCHTYTAKEKDESLYYFENDDQERDNAMYRIMECCIFFSGGSSPIKDVFYTLPSTSMSVMGKELAPKPIAPPVQATPPRGILKNGPIKPITPTKGRMPGKNPQTTKNSFLGRRNKLRSRSRTPTRRMNSIQEDDLRSEI